MTKIILTYLIFVVTFLTSCDRSTEKPKHFTDEFKFKDRNDNENIFFGFKNLDSALYWAKKENKNILVLFSGYACMAVPGQEWQTLTYYGNNNKIQNKYILLWLPVDDRTPLKDTLRFSCKGPQIKTIGDYNLNLQKELTQTNTQPTMCFIDTTMKRHGHLLHYDKDIQKLRMFIESGG